MIILGIDPGTARMGYGVIKVEKCKDLSKDLTPFLLEADTIITLPESPMPKRLKFMYTSLETVVNKYSPDIMVIEKLFFNTNVRTAISVGQARGVSLMAAAERDLMLFEYTALEAKKVLTGYGRASKQEMQQAVKDILGLDKHIKSDDANDGIAMALCFMQKDLKNLW